MTKAYEVVTHIMILGTHFYEFGYVTPLGPNLKNVTSYDVYKQLSDNVSDNSILKAIFNIQNKVFNKEIIIKTLLE